jgi:hypothetical protein
VETYAFFQYSARYWGNFFQQISGDHHSLDLLASRILHLHNRQFHPAIGALYKSMLLSSKAYDRFLGIHAAAFFGLERFINVLATEQTFSPTDDHGRTPLIYAAMNGHEAVVRLLLARDDVDADAKG